jgi:hypothetical protein
MSLSGIGVGSGTQQTSAWDDLQAWRQQQQDVYQTFSDAESTFADAFGGALTDQSTGLVNLAADAAAARLGVKLNTSSSSGTASGSSTASTAGATKATSPSGAAASPLLGYESFLAAVDQAALPPLPAAAAPAATAATGVQGYDSFLASLDQIGIPALAPANTAAANTPSGAFNLDNYLANLDMIATTPAAMPVTDVTV